MTTWSTVLDLGPLLAGGLVDEPPTLLARTDGRALLYAGKVNGLAGESEAGKTWIAMHGGAEVIATRRPVLVLDFEDSPRGIVSRLLALGVPPNLVADHLHYVRPDERLDGKGRAALAATLARIGPALVVVDGVTLAMSMMGLDPLKNADAATFTSDLLRPLASSGAAVLWLDHMPKDADSRTRGPIGAVTKINAVDGAAYTVDLVTSFGRGRVGRSTLYLAKDRPGYVREYATDRVAATLEMTSGAGGRVTVSLQPADAGSSETWRPTLVMSRVSEALAGHPQGMSTVMLETAVRGKATVIRAALGFLVDDECVAVERRGNAKVYQHLKPFSLNGSGPAT